MFILQCNSIHYWFRQNCLTTATKNIQLKKLHVVKLTFSSWDLLVPGSPHNSIFTSALQLKRTTEYTYSGKRHNYTHGMFKLTKNVVYVILVDNPSYIIHFCGWVISFNNYYEKYTDYCLAQYHKVWRWLASAELRSTTRVTCTSLYMQINLISISRLMALLS